MSFEVPEGWQATNLGEFATLNYGKNLPAKQRVAGPVPVFSSAGEIDSHSDPLTNCPGVVIGRKGSVGSVYFSRVPFWPIDTTFYIEEEAGRDLRFSFWLFKGLQAQLQGMNSDSAVPGLNRENAQQLPILVPPLGEQRRIAWVLGTLDDKIELNRKMARTLEETAAAIFKARFVDFEGVEEFDDSEIGPIPKGWKVSPLSKLATVTMGQSPPSSTYSEDRAIGPPLVQGKGAFGERFPSADQFCGEGTRFAAEGDLLLTVRAPVGDTNICRETTCLGRGVAGVSSEFPGFIENALRVCSARWAVDESGTIYPAVNKKQVEGFKICVPEEAALREAESELAPLMRKVSDLHLESEVLAALCDELLPKLISGKIRVPEGVGPDLDQETAQEVAEELTEA